MSTTIEPLHDQARDIVANETKKLVKFPPGNLVLETLVQYERLREATHGLIDVDGIGALASELLKCLNQEVRDFPTRGPDYGSLGTSRHNEVVQQCIETHFGLLLE